MLKNILAPVLYVIPRFITHLWIELPSSTSNRTVSELALSALRRSTWTQQRVHVPMRMRKRLCSPTRGPAWDPTYVGMQEFDKVPPSYERYTYAYWQGRSGSGVEHADEWANGKTTACERCLTRVAYANWKLFQYERTSAAPALGNIQQTAGS